MDPQRLAAIVSSLGLAAFASWLLRLAASAVAARSADRPLLGRVAGSRAWPAMTNAALVAWLTAMGVELALVGMTEKTLQVGMLWFILAVSLLVGRVIDLIRGRSEK